MPALEIISLQKRIRHHFEGVILRWNSPALAMTVGLFSNQIFFQNLSDVGDMVRLSRSHTRDIIGD